MMPELGTIAIDVCMACMFGETQVDDNGRSDGCRLVCASSDRPRCAARAGR